MLVRHCGELCAASNCFLLAGRVRYASVRGRREMASLRRCGAMHVGWAVPPACFSGCRRVRVPAAASGYVATGASLSGSSALGRLPRDHAEPVAGAAGRHAEPKAPARRLPRLTRYARAPVGGRRFSRAPCPMRHQPGPTGA
ncbi:hypothetical protein DM77_2761 [Burkholderia mallei]|nr:hypothetical protein DM77_2761 [Burkholderia mallei]